MTDAPFVLQAIGLRKSYRMPHGVIEVLKGATLAVQAGESLCIMGASGSGKSTLLHLLGGLDTPDSGELRVDDQPIHRWGESRRAGFRARRMGIVFQNYHLLPDLSVFENALMPARALRRWGAPDAAAVAHVRLQLENVGLGHRLGHRPVELSGGEQQRLAIARALANDPDILLADEPTGNLDAETGSRVLDDLFRLSAERHRTLVIVTHDPALAARCSRTVRIADGQVQE
jgi:putative ABC transport system ATP-binding protein